LTLAKLRFPPKWLHLSKKSASKENILHYKIKLLSDKSIQWLYKQRIQQKLSRKKQQEYQNHNLTGSRRKFGEIKSIYTKEKTKNMQ